MAKSKRREIGSVMKAREKGKPDYIQIKEDVVLTKGSFLNLESKQSATESLEAAFAAGKLKEEYVVKQRESLEKWPDFVRFRIIQVQKEE